MSINQAKSHWSESPKPSIYIEALNPEDLDNGQSFPTPEEMEAVRGMTEAERMEYYRKELAKPI